MRILLFIFPLKLILAQDSLFWFDMSSIRDPIPKSPIILDNIYGTSQIKVLDSLKNIPYSKGLDKYFCSILLLTIHMFLKPF